MPFLPPNQQRQSIEGKVSGYQPIIDGNLREPKLQSSVENELA